MQNYGQQQDFSYQQLDVNLGALPADVKSLYFCLSTSRGLSDFEGVTVRLEGMHRHAESGQYLAADVLSEYTYNQHVRESAVVLCAAVRLAPGNREFRIQEAGFSANGCVVQRERDYLGIREMIDRKVEKKEYLSTPDD